MSVIDVTTPLSGPFKSPVSTSNPLEDTNQREWIAQSDIPDLSGTATQTELANSSFYHQAKEIEGAQVRLCGDSWSESAIVVTIPDLFDRAADEVFELETRIHQQYPHGRLDVLIKPRPVDDAQRP